MTPAQWNFFAGSELSAPIGISLTLPGGDSIRRPGLSMVEQAHRPVITTEICIAAEATIGQVLLIKLIEHLCCLTAKSLLENHEKFEVRGVLSRMKNGHCHDGISLRVENCIDHGLPMTAAVLWVATEKSRKQGGRMGVSLRGRSVS